MPPESRPWQITVILTVVTHNHNRHPPGTLNPLDGQLFTVRSSLCKDICSFKRPAFNLNTLGCRNDVLEFLDHYKCDPIRSICLPQFSNHGVTTYWKQKSLLLTFQSFSYKFIYETVSAKQPSGILKKNKTQNQHSEDIYFNLVGIMYVRQQTFVPI